MLICVFPQEFQFTYLLGEPMKIRYVCFIDVPNWLLDVWLFKQVVPWQYIFFPGFISHYTVDFFCVKGMYSSTKHSNTADIAQ